MAEAWESPRQQAILGATRSGFRPWLQLPLSQREKDAGGSNLWLARLASPTTKQGSPGPRWPLSVQGGS
eukprot:4153176-Alexandrium_andersonii.AAC.1